MGTRSIPTTFASTSYSKCFLVLCVMKVSRNQTKYPNIRQRRLFRNMLFGDSPLTIA